MTNTYRITDADGALVNAIVADDEATCLLLYPGHTATLVPEVAQEPSAEQRIAAFSAKLTAHLDRVAQERRYDNRITCMVRAGFPGPFQAEAVAFALWCDACNAQAYALLAEVQAGTRPLPDSPQALIDALPAMEWPAA